MTNVEYYLHDFLKEDNRFQSVVDTANLNPCSCESLVNWLFDEHEEERILENADGLVYGQEIMVRNNKDFPWITSFFVGYYNDMFFVATDFDKMIARGFNQAKLPEKGE